MAYAHLIFLGVLLLNTVFSVWFFHPMIARDWRQWLVDAALVALYGALALTLGDGLWFSLSATLLFVVATLKYVLGWESIPPQVLRRKLVIDLLGILLCFAVLVGTLAGHEKESAWALAIIFALANIYLLVIRPMYRL